jgi:hypothetical protein
MKSKARKGIFLLAMLVISATAFGEVIFDPTTGIGFVGKGDVQNAFGWNNATLQKNAEGVTFTFIVQDVYSVQVEFTSGNGSSEGNYHLITVERVVSINATVGAEFRIHKQIDGFYLTGFGDKLQEGTVPQVGDQFNDNTGQGQAADKVIVGVTLVSSESSGFSVNYGGISFPLTY